MQMTDPTELLIVEGKSAAQALNSVISRRFQTVLAMQGKVPNCLKSNRQRLLDNAACQRLFDTLGCDVGENCHPDRLRFDHIYVVSDGDIDGLHARILLFRLFQHWLTPVVTAGRLYSITCPVYAIRTHHTTADSQGTLYAWSEEERGRHLASMPNPSGASISYLKGIASLTASECYTLLVNPATRLARPVCVRSHTHTGELHENST